MQQQQNISTKGNDAEDIRKELAKANALLAETDSALEEWESECEKLNAIIKSKDSQLKNITSDIEQLKEKLAAAEKKTLMAEKKTKDVGTNLAGQNAASQPQQSSQAPIAALQSQLQAKDRRAHELNGQLSSLKTRINHIQESTKKKDLEVSKLKEELKLLKEQFNNLKKEKENSQLNDHIDNELNSKLGEIERLVREKENEKVLLLSELKEQKIQLEQYKFKIAVADFGKKQVEMDNDFLRRWSRSVFQQLSKL